MGPPRADGGEDLTGEARRIAGPLGLGLGLPLALVAGLGVFRPDLFRPMLHHLYGYVWAKVVVELSAAASGFYLTASLASFRARWPRIVLTLAGFLLCTFPAVFAILFGPIVFAFAFGASLGY